MSVRALEQRLRAATAPAIHQAGQDRVLRLAAGGEPVLDLPPSQIATAPAEDPLGGGIREGDPTGQIHHDQRAVDVRDDVPRVAPQRLETLREPLALRHVRDDDERAAGTGEASMPDLVGPPAAVRGLRVLDADPVDVGAEPRRRRDPAHLPGPAEPVDHVHHLTRHTGGEELARGLVRTGGKESHELRVLRHDQPVLVDDDQARGHVRDDRCVQIFEPTDALLRELPPALRAPASHVLEQDDRQRILVVRPEGHAVRSAGAEGLEGSGLTRRLGEHPDRGRGSLVESRQQTMQPLGRDAIEEHHVDARIGRERAQSRLRIDAQELLEIAEPGERRRRLDRHRARRGAQVVVPRDHHDADERRRRLLRRTRSRRLRPGSMPRPTPSLGCASPQLRRTLR